MGSDNTLPPAEAVTPSNEHDNSANDSDIIVDEFRTVLATVDRSGRRKWVYVDIPQGFWRRLKKISAFGLIGFYLAAPFITIGGNPLLRFDLPAREFTIFGQIFTPQDMPFALLFFLLFLFGTILTVSLLGRVFCGWLCPHNVFLEMVYRPIEALLEGKAHRRRRNDQNPNANLMARKVVKYVLFILVSGILANTATALFVDKSAFMYGFLIDPINHTSAAVFFAFFFCACMFNFAWFREQTCTIVCPYGRLQSALLDPHTLTVAYDHNRGEARGRRVGNKRAEGQGDCIDCYRCVAVCPTGIDIRNGIQMECINCTACIDACDTVMDKVGQEHGLIRFTSENTLAGKPRKIFRGRTFVYMAVITVLLVILGFAVAGRHSLDIIQLRDTNQPQVRVAEDGSTYVIRIVPIEIANKTSEPQEVRLWVPEGDGTRLEPAIAPFTIAPKQQRVIRAAMIVPRAAFTGPVQDFDLLVGNESHTKTITITYGRPPK